MAWFRGLKTTYYLRALSATTTEKSTVAQGTLNKVSSDISSGLNAASASMELAEAAPVPKACSLDNPDCEACQ